MKDQSLKIEKILDIIYSSIDDHNKLNPDHLKIKKSLNTILIGPKGDLDSLGVITLLVEIENNVKNDLDNNICVIDENLFLDENGPYSSVKALSEYILNQM